MIAMLIHYMAPIMFASLVVFLLLGYPVAFSLAANGLFFAFIGIELGLFQPDFMQALPERVYGVMNNDTLLAIPFFTFMGLILERSGMAEDLLETIGQLFGTVRGGLAYAVIFVGALLAATTGVVAASVISMGLISLPIMLRYGYDRSVASGVIAASGTLAQIIPPSLVLIVMADQLGRSVGDMYEGAFIPGLVLSTLYAGYVFLVTMISPDKAPGLPLEAQTLREPETLRHPLILPLALASAALATYALVWRWHAFDWSQPAFGLVGAGEIVMRIFWTAVIFGIVWKALMGTIRTMTISLYLTVILAATIALVIMSRTKTQAPARIMSCSSMSIGVAVAFVIAVINKVLRLKLLSKTRPSRSCS